MANINSVPLPDTIVAEPVGPNHDQCPKTTIAESGEVIVCGAQLYKEGDPYGPYEKCLQDGYVHDLGEKTVGPVQAAVVKDGTIRRLKYRGSHPDFIGSMLIYRYTGTRTSSGTDTWRPDCPWGCGTTMTKVGGWHKGGDQQFRCKQYHFVKILAFENGWR